MRVRDYGLLTRLIRTRPVVLAALLYLTGCILGYAFPFPIVWIAVMAAVCAVLALLLCRHRAAAALVLLAMLPIGMLRFDAAWRTVDPLPERKNASLTGRICAPPDFRADTERTVCVIENLTIDGTPVSGKLRLYLRGDTDALRAVRLGQRVSCDAHIWQADEAANPGEFNFSNYLRMNGLRGYATAEIGSASFEAPVLTLWDLPARFQESAGKAIDRRFPENADIVRAFLIGDRSRISEEDRQSYSNSGAAHLLALSGMHISVIALLLSGLLTSFLKRRHAFIITLVILAVYGFLIGFTASFTRALLMYAYTECAPICGRRSDGVTGLSISMLLWLTLRPIDILSASFVLSYAATAGILLLIPPLSMIGNLQRFLIVSRRRSFRHWFLHGLPKRIVFLTLSTAAAQIATLPAVVHYFGAQPLLAFFVNLAAVPVAMFAYIAAIPGAITGIPFLCAVSDRSFGLLTRVVRAISRVPYAMLRVARFPVWLILLTSLALVLATNLTKTPKTAKMLLPFTLIVAVMLSNLCAYLTTVDTSVVFLAADEADCAVIRTGGHVYMIDAGDDYSPAAGYLSAMNYVPDAVFLTHPHADHVCGLNGVLDTCTPKRIYISTNWNCFEPVEAISEIIDRAIDGGTEIIPVSAGDVITLDEKTFIHILAPSAGFPANSANDDSLILHLIHGDGSALFLGDASAKAMNGILPDADILKIAHHGAADSTDASLLEAVSPSVCVIPSGYNTYGHPDPRTLALIEASGASLFRTDQSGAVACALESDGTVRVSTFQ